MVRPLKGRKRVMVRGFCYPGEYDEFFDKLSLSLAADHKTLSDYLLQVSLEDSKKRYPKIGAPELLKALQERENALKLVEDDAIENSMRDLDDRMKKFKFNPSAWHHKMAAEIKKALHIYTRHPRPELKAKIDEARSLMSKPRDEAKRGS